MKVPGLMILSTEAGYQRLLYSMAEAQSDLISDKSPFSIQRWQSIRWPLHGLAQLSVGLA
jgi:hypothetical protein